MADKTVTIAGLEFTLPSPYAEGHPLSAVEAKVLNQTWHENVRNNTAKYVKEAVEKGVAQDEIAANVAKYAGEYTFSTPGTGGTRRVMDPVEREARAIARENLKAVLAQQGRKIKDVDPEKLEAAIEQVLARNPDIQKLAAKRVKERQKVAEVDIGDLDLGAAATPTGDGAAATA